MLLRQIQHNPNGVHATYYKGETSESPDLTDTSTENIKKNLKDMMYDTSVTIVILSPNMKESTVTKSYLHHEMDRGANAAGVKRIRIHDLRHSHISLLIDMGFSAVAIADRVGHESIDITYQYAHLFPSKQTEMADRLDDLGKGEVENVS